MFRKNVMHRVLIAAAVVVIGAFGAFSYYVNALQYRVTSQQVESQLKLTGQQAAQSIANWLNGRVILTEVVSDSIAKVNTLPEAEAVLKNNVLTREFVSTYLGDEQGNFVIWPFSENPPGYDTRQRPWYQDAVKSDKPTLTEPYVDASTNVLMISAAIPTKRDGKLIGVTASDFSLDTLSNMIKQVSIPNQGFAFLVNKDGQVLIHPDANLVTKMLSDAFPVNTPVIGPGTLETELNGKTVLVNFVPVEGLPSVQWYLASIMDKSATFSSISDFRIAAAIATALAFVLMMAMLTWVLSGLIMRPVGTMTNAMKRLANGTLDIAIPGQQREDQIGQMAEAVAVFRDNAVERRRLEEEAVAYGAQIESERLERERVRANENQDLQHAVSALGLGLDRLASGELTYRIDAPFAERFDRLREDYNRSVSKLNETLRNVENSASAINGGAMEIRSSADDLAKRTERQAASVEETAAALEQITEAVNAAAQRAVSVGKLVEGACNSAEKSGMVVDNAIVAMQQIANSSNEISKIIGVIDEIAFQTNLLALNAGVEAARAGEAGKGFAVVAQEVRELAQRSAVAAREIKTLISASENQVRNGVGLVGETGLTLKSITGEVQGITGHISAIISASHEQANALTEINRAVNMMDQNTQRNAAMVEEQTAASHGLASEVANLSQQLKQFSLGAQGFERPRRIAA